MRKWIKDLKRRWLLYWFRRTLREYKVNESRHSDEALELWIKEAGPLIGMDSEHRPEHFHQNYVEVKPADKAVKPDVMRLSELAMQYELTHEEIELVYSRCNKDIIKTYKVLQMMQLTFNTDEVVIMNYEQFYEQLKYKLK